jgi:hypothetical protein
MSLMAQRVIIDGCTHHGNHINHRCYYCYVKYGQVMDVNRQMMEMQGQMNISRANLGSVPLSTTLTIPTGTHQISKDHNGNYKAKKRRSPKNKLLLLIN